MTDLFPEPRLAPDAPEGLGVMMAGGAGKSPRNPNDYYPTPDEGVRSIIQGEWARLAPLAGAEGALWEPCGRGGAVQRVAAGFGLSMIGTDLIADPANGVRGVDLFSVQRAPARTVISNFPWALGRAMVGHCWAQLELDYMALLFKTQWLACDKGAEMVRAGLGPVRRYDLTYRLDFQRMGNPTMNCSWFIWDRIDTRRHHGLLDREGEVTPAAALI